MTRVRDSKISVAPMMAWTNKYCRYFHRLLAPHTLLYTEMVTTGALLHGDIERHLEFFDEEHPITVQLGGADPEDLAKASRLCEKYGYDAINLNCGCPSDRVQKGAFGACLMKEPDHVRDCVQAMIEAVNIPVTVKCRIGVDEDDPHETLPYFIEKVSESGCNHFIIHARKAWLKGLSPKQNRDVPPLDYDLVYNIKQNAPHLKIEINGGIQTVEQSLEHLKYCDGVMIGREAYQNPYILHLIENQLYKTPVIDRHVIVNQIANFIRLLEYEKRKLAITPIIGLYKGVHGGKAWRQLLSIQKEHITDTFIEEMVLLSQKLDANIIELDSNQAEEKLTKAA